MMACFLVIWSSRLSSVSSSIMRRLRVLQLACCSAALQLLRRKPAPLFRSNPKHIAPAALPERVAQQRGQRLSSVFRRVHPPFTLRPRHFLNEGGVSTSTARRPSQLAASMATGATTVPASAEAVPIANDNSEVRAAHAPP